MESQFWIGLLQIIWIDLLLSGDNAVVIALACRGLPEKQRKWGILLGAGAAVGLRIIFALAITYLLAVPFLKLVGGLLLFWIATKLIVGEEGGDGHGNIEESDNLWKAVRKRKNVIYTPFFWRYIMLIIRHIPEPIFKKMKI